LTAARGVALSALVLAILLAGYLLLFRGGGGHEYTLVFQTAGQLVKDDDVQVGGRRIGSIRDIRLTDDNQAEIDIDVDRSFGRLHEGTTAAIRATSLSGIANRYVALSPGANSRPALGAGAVLRADSTTSIVDLDELFNTIDPSTRRALQQFIQGNARWYAGRGEQANQAARYLDPALSSSRRLVNEVVRDQETFNDFLKSSQRTVSALAERRGALADLVSNANTTADAIGDENASLATALGLLPDTLRKANTTFVNLRATLDDLDVLVAESKPATKRLAPFLRELRPLVRDARPTIADLRTLVRRPGDGNDLVELLQRTPRLERVARPALRNSVAALRRSTPVLKFVRPYTTDFAGWVRDFGQGASNYDANGHYARIQPIFNAYSFADNPAGGTLTPIAPSQRLAGLQTGFVKRCPGAASQPPPDGSAPWRDAGGTLDCDPSLVLPGP
jgi:phospholipid/cholesterol/gamma-HCH transport system substrate-binding protein